MQDHHGNEKKKKKTLLGNLHDKEIWGVFFPLFSCQIFGVYKSPNQPINMPMILLTGARSSWKWKKNIAWEFTW